MDNIRSVKRRESRPLHHVEQSNQADKKDNRRDAALATPVHIGS